MKKFKKLFVGILLVCTLFSCVGCSRTGTFITDEYINGERVANAQEWTAVCNRTDDAKEKRAFEVQTEGEFKVSLFKAKGGFKAQSAASTSGMTSIEVQTEEKFPLKPKNKNNALVMYEDGRELVIVVEENGKRVGHEGEKYLEEFLYGEYGVCYATYMISELLMGEVVRNAYDCFKYNSSNKAYELNENSVPRDRWGELNDYDIDLQALDFKVWICNGKIEKMVFNVEAKSNKFLKGVTVEGVAVGQFRWLDE